MAATAVAAAGKKGPNMTMPEDVEMAKAFVATSEDNIVGSNQKSSDFKSKMLVNYNELIRKYNRLFSQQCVLRSNQNSLFSRFKSHSRMVLKMIGIEETMGAPPSGDTDRERFNQMIKDTWAKRNPDDCKLVDTIWALKLALSKHPKWRKFQTDEDAADDVKRKKREAKQSRPVGSKKAKQAESDKKLIQSLVSTVSVQSREANDGGVTKVADSLELLSKALVQNMQSQNDMRIMECSSPKTKEAMGKQMALLRMRQMQEQLDKLNPRPNLVDVPEDEQEDPSNLTDSLD